MHDRRRAAPSSPSSVASPCVRPGGVLHVAHAVGDADVEQARARRDRAWTRLHRLMEQIDGSGCVLERHVIEREPAPAPLALAEQVVEVTA
jgi:hypothetical protein